MKYIAIAVFVMVPGVSTAEIIEQDAQRYQCITTGGFFDFSPDNAIKSCREEITKFCEEKGSPTLIEKTNGIPSGYGRYARAEISFQCTTQANIDETNRKQERTEIDSSKIICQQDFGFTPGTPEFGKCMLELIKQKNENRRTKQEHDSIIEAAEARIRQQRDSDTERAMTNAVQSINQSINNATSRGVTTTNCSTIGGNVSCISR